MADRNRVDSHSLRDIVDRCLGVAEQGLENLILRAFHAQSITASLNIVNILEKYHKY